MLRVVTGDVGGIAPNVFVGRLAPAPGGSSRDAVGVGRVVGASAGAGSFQLPLTVERKGDGTAKSTEASGHFRIGRQTTVKPGLHWALVRNAKGDYELQNVQGWMEFGPPQKAQASKASSVAVAVVPAATTPAQGQKIDKRTLTGKLALKADMELGEGEKELLEAAGMRKKFADRWEAICERRDVRTGTLERKTEPGEGDPSKPTKGDIEYPEEVRLADDTGLRHQKKKATKALKKKAAALDDLEDLEDVPETANALLELKHEKGEGGWDFSDAEQYSDDDVDKFEWEGEESLKRPEEEEEAQVSADEDEGVEEEKGTELSTHGKELQVLMDNYGGEEEPCGEEGGGDVDQADVALLQEAQADVDASGVLPAASESDAEAPEDDDENTAKRRRISDVEGGGVSSRTAPASAPPRPAAAAAPAAVASASGTVPKPAGEPTDAQLRTQAIACLREKGGQCTLADAAAALGLRDRHANLYQRVVATLKQVASIERVAGQARPVLVLKKEHHG